MFSQHHVDGLDLALSPLQIMLNSYAGLKDQEARQHLGSFGVSGPLALQPMYTLSGGQKSRVALAKVGVGHFVAYLGVCKSRCDVQGFKYMQLYTADIQPKWRAKEQGGAG